MDDDEALVVMWYLLKRRKKVKRKFWVHPIIAERFSVGTFQVLIAADKYSPAGDASAEFCGHTKLIDGWQKRLLQPAAGNQRDVTRALESNPGDSDSSGESVMNDDGVNVSKISMDELKRSIKCMKNGKAVGFDSIAAEYFKGESHIILTWLCKLFNQCLEEGYMPLDWRRAVIMPLYKGMRLESKIEKCRMLMRYRISWDQLKDVRLMNSKPSHNQAYVPTEIEHIANMVTHGVCMMPSVLAACELLRRSGSFSQVMAAGVYGAALSMLFAVSTTFHSVFYCRSNCHMRHVLHRCDRAMIYVFIAGSYFPWLTIGSPKGSLLEEMRWIIWLLATLGIAYQQMFHERFKRLETIFYLITGIGPSIAIIMSDHEFAGMGELKLGGLFYIIGVFFFKSDGVIPLAHAIWHVFVAIAATVHYMAILNNLYPASQEIMDDNMSPLELML